MPEPPDCTLVAAHVFPRRAGTLVGAVLGVGIGVGNAALGVIFPSWLATLAILLAGLALVLVLHEGLHGLTARLLGYRPRFGVEPPLVFTTFDERLLRDHLLAVALAPLLVLDVLFLAGWLAGPWPVFWNLCLAINTIGSIGDVWISWKLLGHPADTWFQDTKSGVEAWAAPASPPPMDAA